MSGLVGYYAGPRRGEAGCTVLMGCARRRGPGLAARASWATGCCSSARPQGRDGGGVVLGQLKEGERSFGAREKGNGFPFMDQGIEINSKEINMDFKEN